MKKIIALSGSIKAGSTNNRILSGLQSRYSHAAEIHIYPSLAELPYFNPDLDQEAPPAIITELRNMISRADGLIICTPEYVFSLPGVLKNALEWMVSSSTFSGKPAALIVAATSGQQAMESLQLVMRTIEARVAPEMKLLIQGAKGKINAEDNAVWTQLDQVMHALLAEMER